jgi:hypothetical protein
MKLLSAACAALHLDLPAPRQDEFLDIVATRTLEFVNRQFYLLPVAGFTSAHPN